jgi:hypothetical protein
MFRAGDFSNWWTMLTRVNFETYDDTKKEGGDGLVFFCSLEMIFN